MPIRSKVVRSRSHAEILVGLMSGTSADGIDAVVTEIRREPGRAAARLLHHRHFAFPKPLRERVLKVSLHGTVAEICELNFELGDRFARAALGIIARAGLKPNEVRGIGSHGQTVQHLPNARYPSTLQIGEPAIIAERTGITTVADFRTRDMAAGGQGAPLVPYTDWLLFSDPVRPRIVQNIGGIGNLTFLAARGAFDKVVAWDTGPGNMVMDGVVARISKGKRTYDQDGRMARRGRVNQEMLRELLKHPFLRKAPPKTTGREEFGEVFLNNLLARAKKLRLSDEDIVATATAFTARTIVDSCERWLFPKLLRRGRLQFIAGGGGTKNRALMEMLKSALPGIEILTHKDFGIDNSAKEALAFSIMAYETLAGRPANVPGATGARHACVLGKIVPGGPGMVFDPR